MGVAMIRGKKGIAAGIACLVLAGAYGIGWGASITYTYDARGRLTLADYGGGRTIAYTYDAAGNTLTRNSGGVVVPVALTVSKAGSGTGTVTSSPTGITCGATCSYSFNSGSEVTLSALADSGSSFAGWTGACSGTGTCTVVIEEASSVTANFVSTAGKTMVNGMGTIVNRSNTQIAGATVRAYLSGTWELVTSAVTDANGSFTLSIPNNTDLALEIAASGYRTAYSQKINISASSPLDTFTLMSAADYAALGWPLMADKAFLRGKTVNSQSQLLSGVTLTAASTVGSTYTVQYVTNPVGPLVSGGTQANGLFVLAAATPGDTITLSASSAGKTFNQPVYPHVVADTDLLGLVYETTSGGGSGSISGHLQNTGNQPVSAFVDAYLIPGGTVAATGQANASGDYTIANLAAGTYKLRFYGGPTQCQQSYYSGKTDLQSADPVAVGTSAVTGRNATLTCSGGGGPTFHTLAFAVTPTGSGTVASPMLGINCPAGTCSAQVPAGPVIFATTATAAQGYHFVNWTGTNGFTPTTANPLSGFTVTGAMTVTANFAVDAAPVDGACGSVHGTFYAVQPSSGLCSGGTTPSAMDGTGPWTWSCPGQNGGNPANCSTTAQPSLRIILLGAGSGSVTISSSQGNSSCAPGACPAVLFPYNTTVSLLPVATGLSVFGGWNGACLGAPDTCNLTMDADKSAAAAFMPADRARIGAVGYPSLALAYAAASPTAPTTIHALETDLAETLDFNQARDIILWGGWKADYSETTGQATGLHQLTLTSGSLQIKGIVVVR